MITGAVLISFSGVWVETAHVPPTVSAFYRLFFGCLFLIPASIIRREFVVKSLKKYLIVTFSGLFLALDLYCWHKSIQYIGPGLATMLGNFQVFGLTLVGIMFFREKLRIVFVLSLPLAMPHIQASRTGLILLLQPALAFVWDVLFFARPTDLINWVGVMLTMSAIYMGMVKNGNGSEYEHKNSNTA